MKLELRSLRAINCGPLRDVCIHFTPGERGVTVLAGANGSGKTTVLELIFALCEMLRPLPGRGDDPKSLVRGDYAQAQWLVDGREFDLYYGKQPVGEDVVPESLGWSSAQFYMREQNGIVASEISERIARQEQQKLTLRDGPFLSPQTHDGTEVDDLSDALPSVLYFPFSRFLPPVKGEQVQREETEYRWTFQYQPGAHFKGSLSSCLIWLDYAEPETFAQVVHFLNGLDFDGKTFGVSRKELQAVVNTRDGRTHDVTALSSGEQNILIMLVELRRRLLPHSIVLIDEIENSLHPAFQKRLGEALKRMQEQVPFQLIVTTHSTAFVEIFGPASTRILTEF